MASDKDTIIKVTNAAVRFNMASERIDNLKEYFVKLIKRELMFQEFMALKDINFEVKRGEAWGLIPHGEKLGRILHLHALDETPRRPSSGSTRRSASRGGAHLKKKDR